MYRISQDANGIAIFVFLAKITTVEWSLVQATEDGKEINYLTTSHEAKEETGGYHMMNDKKYKPGTLRRHIHNHNSGAYYPSGSYLQGEKSAGDIEFAKKLNKYNGIPLSYSIYLGKTSERYYPYEPDNIHYLPNNPLYKLLRDVSERNKRQHPPYIPFDPFSTLL